MGRGRIRPILHAMATVNVLKIARHLAGAALVASVTAALPPDSPIAAIHAHVCGFHFYSGDPTRALRVEHYCSHLNPDVLQCVIYDSPAKDARLIGVEYIISEALFQQLPAEEKKLWHSHRYEVMSGLLAAPDLSGAAEKALMRDLVSTYGKCWNLWQVDRGDPLPFGLPKLMMGFTADGQIDPRLVAERDRGLNVDTAQAKAARADLPTRPVAAGADGWQSGPAFQINEPPPPIAPAVGTAAARSSSYLPVAGDEPFAALAQRMTQAKPAVMQAHQDFLAARYDLADRPAPGVTMSRGKPVQQGPRAKLAPGITWDALAALTTDEIRARDIFPAGFRPLPHPNHAEGGMVFPHFVIAELQQQEQRDLARFDLDFDLPDHFLPEFPAPIYLTTRPDLGDVSQGRAVTLDNYFALFNGLLNPKQLEGLRLLLTPFPQQQFNSTDDRRSARPSRGVACFDCHANGHTDAATHLAGDARPQAFRHRVDTPTLRGVNVQQVFGSQRALKSVEDFTEFEQRGAYFDGDPVIATKKGANVLERGSQVHAMAEMQALFDFPPAPKLNVLGRLDPGKASEPERRGQDLFFGKAQCAACHAPPYYTDNSMHDLQTGRFYAARLVHGAMTTADGPIKTFPLRGIKDSPPYLHDGRLLTLADTVEFFNLILETHLTAEEKSDLEAFLRVL
jgi:cytochrome c peroxidase